MAIDTKLASSIGNKFGFTLANTSGASKTVILCPAHFDTMKVVTVITQDESTGEVTAVTNTVQRTEVAKIVAAGFDADCVIDDGTIAEGVVATPVNSKFAIRQFLDFVKLNAQIIEEITIQASNPDVFSKVLTMAQVSPLRKVGEDYVNIQDYYDQYQTQTNKITIKNVGAVLNKNTLLSFPLDNNRTVTFTLKFKSAA
ncbi:MAG: hypothetical protein EOL88_07035 [Bacteroidia bacterium]|nr:hypothetical protein [Bacteroidales bacterium]MDD3011322.1 hypothetical protein [Bacteroidales bacterium]MDD3962154.1 hypothetical protein [Bacteroidales bacterium]MDY0286818.1 hypothetical protein [Bacteroidales bacterium]NCD41830.1 hypothetical protein [Bacteroidia bacterium]